MSERRQRAPSRGRAKPAGNWHARMGRAAELLDTTAQIAELALQVRATELCDQPTAAPLAGRQALAAARSVGLFAGAFNPLTPAHEALAAAARTAGDLDVIAWTLAVVTVDKERVERATLLDRLAQLAAYSVERPESALVVVNRGLYVDQARALHALMAPDARLAIVIGFDKVIQIFDPRYYSDRDAALTELMAEAELLVAPRAGQGPHELERLLARPENARFAAAVHAIPLPEEYSGESSSEVRTLAARAPERAPRRLVAPEGWALARLGAYADDDDDATSATAGAAYAVREAWEQVLPSLTARELRRLPSLSALVERTQAPEGAVLRTWLDARNAVQDALIALLR